jgi:hypothetical protein
MFGPEPPELLNPDIGNPLYLSDSERYVCLFSLLDTDGDLLATMYRQLLPKDSFTRAEAGEAGVKALEEFRARRLRYGNVGPSQQVRVRLDRTVAAVKKQKPGGLGPRESLATPRTEPFVDCGILLKTHPSSYEYSFSDWGRGFLQRLVSAKSVTEFIETGLGEAVSFGTVRSVGAEPRLEAIQEPYTRLRSGLGYVSMRELAVAATAQSFRSSAAPVYEISSVENAIRQASREDSRHVRLALGRTGGVAQVRIDQRAFST